MRWEAWVLLPMFLLAIVTAISNVGKQRKPVTGADAVVIVCIDAFFLWLVLRLGGAL